MPIAHSEDRLCLTKHRYLFHYKRVGCHATSDLLRVRAFLSGRQRAEVSMVFLKTPTGIC
jgi:hypothetical protein